MNGTPRPTLVSWLADMVGEDHVVPGEGSLRLLDRLPDLGLEIGRVERSRSNRWTMRRRRRAVPTRCERSPWRARLA